MPLAPQQANPVLKSYLIRNQATGPAAEVAIDIVALKRYLRLTSTAHDDLLADMIPQATALVEEYLGRVLVNTPFEGFADRTRLPNWWWSGVIQAPVSSIFQPTRVFEIPWVPLFSFEELAYIDLSGDAVVVPPEDYIVDVSSKDLWGRVALKYFASATVPAQEINAYRFKWTSGYGPTKTDVPAGIVSGINRVIAFMFENRGDCGCSTEDLIKASGASSFLNRYKVWRI